jgi:hypothetical protein
VQVLIKAAECSGFDSKGVKMSGFIQHHLRCARSVGDPIKYMKYKISAYFAANMCESELELPARPAGLPEDDKPHILFGGKLYKWLGMKMLDENFRRSWCTTVLYSKGGMPRPSKEYVKMKEQEAFVKLTTPVTPPFHVGLDTRTWNELEEDGERSFPRNLVRMAPSIQLGLVSRPDMMEQISRTAKELFSGTVFGSDDLNRPFFPSTSANYYNSRSKGGAVGHLRSNYKRVLSFLTTMVGPRPENIVTSHLQLNPRSTVGARVPVMDMTLLNVRWSHFMEMLKGEAVREPPVAVPLGLQESLKVRVITKGPPVLNTFLKPLQKFLWRQMSAHPMFVLTGRPVDPWVIQDRLGCKLRGDQGFLSVDYEDATNGMFSDCSQAAVDAISECIGLDAVTRHLFLRSLTGHVLENPVKKGEYSQQTRGQLMGSITSFIVLCVVNAAILRWVKELDDGRIYTLRDCGALVNGDDGLLRCTRLGKMYWEQISSFCGLKPSIGKVYFTREFANINSTNFLFDAVGHEENFTAGGHLLTTRRRHFTRTPFLRLSLLYGLQRSSGTGNASAPLTSLGAQCQELLAFCPTGDKERILSSWISLHREQLVEARIPWFIPSALGGLGLPILDSRDPSLRPSDLDLRVARKVHDHPGRYPRPLAPTPGAWFVWKVAQKHAVALGLSKTDAERRFLSELISTEVDSRRYKPLRESHVMGQLVASAFLSGIQLADGGILEMSPDELAANMQKVARDYVGRWSKTYLKALRDTSVPLPEPYNVNNFPLTPPVEDYAIAVVDTLQLQLLHTPLQIHEDRADDPWSLDASVRRLDSSSDDLLWSV